MTITATNKCFFCNDTEPNHTHYTVLIYENGKCLGRLGSNWGVVRLKTQAVLFGKNRAGEVAEMVNMDYNDGKHSYTAKVRKF